MRTFLMAMMVAGCGSEPNCVEGESVCGRTISACIGGEWVMVARYAECGPGGVVNWSRNQVSGTCVLPATCSPPPVAVPPS